ncbi:hypothetical protein SLS62_005191 [Diatrype stigma]|uniref:RING-type domain-containing protein n=1 Tax=Diatrype stigma TaxID=117547 RepID=A0AAN9V1M3_9PEZI
MASEQQSPPPSSPPQPTTTLGFDTGADADANNEPSLGPHADLSSPLGSPMEEEAAPLSSTTDGDDDDDNNHNHSSSNHNPNPHDEENTHRCFICLTDEPEETLSRADWVTPCGCTLEGHQACLLDWIADLEAQGKELWCPLCHGPIRLSGERRSAAVRLHQALGLALANWSPTVVLAFLGAGTVAGSAAYGFEALELFAGPDVAASFLLRDKPVSPFPPELQRRVPALSLDGGWFALRALSSVHFGPLCVLPLIGPALMIQSQAVGWNSLIDPKTQAISWPPTMQQAFTLLPAVQSSYTILYNEFLGRLEKKWEKMAKRPYTPQARENGAATAIGAAEPGVVAVPPPPTPGAEAQAANHHEDDNNHQHEDAAEDGDDDAAAAPLANRNGIRVEVDGVEDMWMVSFVAGALLWPGVCYGMGALMRLLLPRRFVTRPTAAAAAGGKGPITTTGLLQERWGRSLVGGCLFVVLKDAFSLYVKYRRAMDRPHRRVRNVDRSRVRNRK